MSEDGVDSNTPFQAVYLGKEQTDLPPRFKFFHKNKHLYTGTSLNFVKFEFRLPMESMKALIKGIGFLVPPFSGHPQIVTPQ